MLAIGQKLWREDHTASYDDIFFRNFYQGDPLKIAP